MLGTQLANQGSGSKFAGRIRYPRWLGKHAHSEDQYCDGWNVNLKRENVLTLELFKGLRLAGL